MKKQIKKLSINKKTISNLNLPEMNQVVGGKTGSCFHPHGCGGNHSANCTQNQNTCPGHNTCYTC